MSPLSGRPGVRHTSSDPWQAGVQILALPLEEKTCIMLSQQADGRQEELYRHLCGQCWLWVRRGILLPMPGQQLLSC